MIGRKLVVLLAAAVVACAAPLAASAKPAAANASPKEWTKVMCTSLVGWQKTVMQSATSLQSTLTKLKKSGDIDLRSIRGEFASFLDRLAKSTDDVRAQLHEVGAPSISHGDDIERQLESAFKKLAGNFQGIADRARKMPLGNPKAFLRQANALEKSISNATDSLGPALSALDKYDATAIEKAAKSLPACKSLG